MAFPVTVFLDAGPDSTARRGDDYFLPGAGVEIEPGELTATFLFAAYSDSVREGDEELELVPRVSIGGMDVIGLTQTITIINVGAGLPVLSITTDSGDVSEPIGGFTLFEIAVRLDVAISEDLTVTIRVHPSSTAKEGEDFELLPPVVIPAGMTTIQDDDPLDVRILSDSIYEGDEYIVLELTTDNPNVRTPDRITITIKDKLPTASLDPFDPTILEGNDLEITARLDVAAAVTVTVELGLGVGSSAVESDYDLSPLSAQIAAGDLTATFRLTALEDTLYEFSETLVLQPVTSYGADELAGVAGTVVILENDLPLTVALDPSGTISITEGTGPYEITVRLNRVQGVTTVVELIELADSTAKPSADYELSTSSVKIAAGALTATFTITAIPDGIYEGLDTETLRLMLRVIVDGTEVAVGSREILILDADPAPSISFVSASSTIAEDAANPRHEIELTLNGALADEDITVTFMLAGSATNSGINADYTLTSTMVTIKAGASAAIIRLDVNDDELYEGLESETVVLSLVSATGGVAVAATKSESEHRVTIEDDDPAPSISFVSESSTIAEDAANPRHNIELTLNGVLTEDDITVTFMLAGSAMRGADYTLTATVVTIPAGTSVAIIRLDVNDDELYDSLESETVVLSLLSATGGVTVAATKSESEHRVTIEDDDPAPSISFVSESSKIAEDAANSRHNIELTLNGVLTEDDITVTFMLAGSATRGADYTLTATVVTIPAGTSTAIIRLDVNDDELYDSLESETVVLSLVSATGGVTVAATKSESEHRVTITDNDLMPTVTITPASPLVEEGETATFTVTLNGRAEADIVITLTPSPGSGSGAAEVGDYVTGSVSVTFTSAVDRVKTLLLRTTEDEVYEGDEEVALDFSISGPATRASVPSTLTIEDDDSAPSISFASASSTIAEDAADSRHEIELTLNGALAEDDITVAFTITGSATMSGINADYTLTATVVTIKAGTRTATIRLDVNDDGLYEGLESEKVVLRLTSASSAVGEILPSAPDVHTVTIIDAQRTAPTLSLEPPAAVTEGGARNVRAVLTGALDEPVEVLLTVTGGDADTADYTLPTTLRVTIPAGDTSVVFEITATIDNLYEGATETVELTLSVPNNGITVANPVQTLTIMDLDTQPILSLEVPTEVRENVGVLVLTATLDGELDVSVPITLSASGTAIDGDDYTFPASLTIPARARVLTFAITIIDDDLYEFDETVELTLSVPGKEVLEGIVTDTFRITNDDQAPLVTVTTPASVEEGNDIVVTVMLDRRSGAGIDIVLESVTPGANAEADDFEVPAIGGATISRGQTIFNIKTNPDDLYEGDKTIDITLSVNGEIFTSTVTIRDAQTPPLLTLSGPSTVSENNAVAVFTATLSGDLPESDLSLELVVVGGDADPGDYTLITPRATITRGQSVAIFTLQTIDNQISYGDKTLRLELRRVSGSIVRLGEIERTLTIREDDDVPLLSLREIASVEEGLVGLVTATLNRVSGRTITVELIPSHTDADLADYSTPTTLRAVIPAGELTATFTIMATLDGIYEESETLDFTLRVVGGGANVIEPRSRQLLILDGDTPPSVSFVSVESEIAEDTANPRHEIELTLNGALVDEDITVTFMLAGSATSATRGIINADYTLTSTIVTIPAGTSVAIIRLDVNDDELYEILESETVVLRLVSATGGVTVAATKSESEHTVTITDNDSMPTVTITPMLPSVEEGKDATFTVTLNGQAEADIVVTLTPSPGSGSGAAEVGDYVTGSVSVTFNTGDRVKTLRLQTRDDEVYEGNEEVALDFSISGPATKTSVPSRLTITEDDPRPTVTITSPSVEEGGRAIFTVNLDRSLETTVTIELSVNDGTAGSGDYDVSDSETLLSVTLGAGVRAGTLSLQTLEEDDLYEGDETVLLSFSATSGGENVMGLPISRTLTITDDRDLPQASFVTDSSTIAEGATVAIEFTLDVESYTGTVVVLAVRSTRAMDGLDYVVEQSVTIAAGITSGVIMFEAVADGRYDGGVSETVELRLPGGDLHRVTITDDQIQPTISLKVPDVVKEGDGARYLTATLSGPVAFTVTVTLVAGPDSTAKLADDYYLASINSAMPDENIYFEIKPGELTATVLFGVYNVSDGIPEGEEYLELVPRLNIDGTKVTGLTQTIRIINIDQLPVLSVTSNSFDVTEAISGSEYNQEIDLELDFPVTEDLRVSIRVLPSSTAKEGEDFELLPPVVIPARERTVDDPIFLRFLADSIYEGDEYLVLELTTDNPGVVPPSRITITLKDSDPIPTASLDPFDLTINEGEGREITARLDVAAAVTVTVELALGAGSGAVEADYDLSPRSAQIAPGDLTATFQFDARDDGHYEFTETLILQPITRHDADVLAGMAETVMILENDPPLTVALDLSGTISITEGTGPYEITVRLSRVQGMTTTVELIELAASTAKSPADYELSTSRVQIAAGASTATFTITAKSDGIYEGLDTETLRLMLRVIVDGANVAVGSREILIVDDDPAPSISFVSASSTIAEDAANPRHEIELTLNGALADEDITVAFMITGSATRNGINADYTLTATVVTIRLGPVPRLSGWT